MLIFLFRHFLHLPPTFLQQSLLKSLNFINKCDKLLSNNETFFPETSDCYACICIFFLLSFLIFLFYHLHLMFLTYACFPLIF